MKVLLIEPRNCWIGLNIALGYLASSLKNAGHEVKILDLTNHRDLPAEILERRLIESYRPDLIGIALFYISYYPVKEMVPRIKGYHECPVVIGGPQMGIEGEDILKDIERLDFAIVGDGEKAIVELCRELEGARDFGSIDGLIHRENGTIVRNRDRKIEMDIDSLPFPDYEPFGIEKIRRYSIITSRGCAYKCTYCFRSSPRWRPRSPENIVEELKHAREKYGIEEFVIVDDAFNMLPERILGFCDLLERDGIRLPWVCTGVRADRMTDALAARMKEAGCREVNVGVETLDPKVHESLGRNISLESIIDCIHILKKHGFKTYGYFMIGLPGETKEITWETYRKAKRIGIDSPQFAILLPFPKTKMHEIVYGTPGVRRIEDYKRISTIWTYDPEHSRLNTAFETPEYTAEEKIDMYNRLRTVEGDPRPPYHKSMFVFGLHAFCWILKYDLLHAPSTCMKLAGNFLERFIKSKGKHVFLTDNLYKESFLREIRSLVSTSG